MEFHKVYTPRSYIAIYSCILTDYLFPYVHCDLIANISSYVHVKILTLAIRKK